MVKEKVLKFFEDRGFTELRPPQKLAVEQGLFEGKNMVIASPTASGKTLVAEMAFLHNLLKGKGKALYLVPLRALAFEKREEFKKAYPQYKVGLSVGDYDSGDEWLSNHDIIISSFEKMDSLMRHGAPWIFSISTVIIDECHLITDPGRGPTLEVLLTKLRKIIPRAQFIALSATISNAEELSLWLDAELVKSDYRPVKLFKGVYQNGKIYFGNQEKKVDSAENDPSANLAKDTLSKKKQCIFFLSSRRNAESLARKLKSLVKTFLTSSEKQELEKLSDKVLNALESPTTQCKRLSEGVLSGVAFHHAGLMNSQRNLLQEAFKNRLLKILCATPTLAMGVNLPAWRVVIRDLKRYSTHHGMAWIPVLEYHQFAGRAGRPGYDEDGQALCIARSDEEKEEIFERYVFGDSEEILSKLGVEPVLRMHSLSLIASLFARSREELAKFFGQTFYAKQYGNIQEIESKLDKIVDEFVEWGFATEIDDKLQATLIGKRISELYLDPLTGRNLIQRLERSKEKIFEGMSLLHMACNTIEMKPSLYVKDAEFLELQSMLAEFSDVLLEDEPSPWDYSFMSYVSAFKTSLMFSDWLDEKGEDYLMEKWRVPPGQLRVKLYNIDWVLYSAQELAKLLKIRNITSSIQRLRFRLKYGVKEELLPLLKFKGVGRVRARKLFNAGIKNVGGVKKVSLEKLESILGKVIGGKVKEQTLTGKEEKGLKEWTELKG